MAEKDVRAYKEMHEVPVRIPDHVVKCPVYVHLHMVIDFPQHAAQRRAGQGVLVYDCETRIHIIAKITIMHENRYLCLFGIAEWLWMALQT